MVNFNGKPYLRIKIRLRVIVWWPFCDFFFTNRIPALVKLTSAKRGGHDFFFPSSWKHHENIKIVTFLIGTVQSGDLALFACYGHRAPKVTQIPPKTPFCPLGGPSWPIMGQNGVFFFRNEVFIYCLHHCYASDFDRDLFAIVSTIADSTVSIPRRRAPLTRLALSARPWQWSTGRSL